MGCLVFGSDLLRRYTKRVITVHFALFCFLILLKVLFAQRQERFIDYLSSVYLVCTAILGSVISLQGAKGVLKDRVDSPIKNN